MPFNSDDGGRSVSWGGASWEGHVAQMSEAVVDLLQPRLEAQGWFN
jgi:hypothetical protein